MYTLSGLDLVQAPITNGVTIFVSGFFTPYSLTAFARLGNTYLSTDATLATVYNVPPATFTPVFNTGLAPYL